MSIPFAFFLSLVGNGQAEGTQEPESRPDPCSYVAGGKKTWQEWHGDQCLPVRCLRRCARYASGLADPEALAVDNGHEMRRNLMHCSQACLLNDPDSYSFPGAIRPDLPCRRHAEARRDTFQNWLQNGKICNKGGTRACFEGECLNGEEFLPRAFSYFVEGSGAEAYMRVAEAGARRRLTSSDGKSGSARYYAHLAKVVLGRALLRPPGPLERPDWKAVEREEFERAARQHEQDQ